MGAACSACRRRALWAEQADGKPRADPGGAGRRQGAPRDRHPTLHACKLCSAPCGSAGRRVPGACRRDLGHPAWLRHHRANHVCGVRGGVCARARRAAPPPVGVHDGQRSKLPGDPGGHPRRGLEPGADAEAVAGAAGRAHELCAVADVDLAGRVRCVHRRRACAVGALLPLHRLCVLRHCRNAQRRGQQRRIWRRRRGRRRLGKLRGGRCVSFVWRRRGGVPQQGHQKGG
mmetsp:Transcript_31640/g.94283  ORF Transcript_31640/g.94283 Transcript_31640/m.94283 type:complete len:231 (-) Transcript_31640:719-1411(-)